jgi:hypothetical protein
MNFDEREIMRDEQLSRFYQFFKTSGTERLNGLDESYFVDLTEGEKQEAWSFLSQGDSFSEESIKGLYILDKIRAISLFKKMLASPIKDSPCPDQRQDSERSRLLLLAYVNSVEPDEKYIDTMSEFANSEFADVRGQFARCLPTHQITPKALAAIKGMVFTEAERIPRTSAITKLMVIHGMDFDMDDPLYKSIYLSLRSDEHKKKLSAMTRLEMNKRPNC